MYKYTAISVCNRQLYHHIFIASCCYQLFTCTYSEFCAELNNFLLLHFFFLLFLFLMFSPIPPTTTVTTDNYWFFNTLNDELNHIYHLLALLGGHHIFHVSGLRVKCIFSTSVQNNSLGLTSLVVVSNDVMFVSFNNYVNT